MARAKPPRRSYQVHGVEAPPQRKPNPTFEQLEAMHEGEAREEARRAGIGTRLCGTTRQRITRSSPGSANNPNGLAENEWLIAFVFPRGTVHWTSANPHTFDVTKGEANG